MTRMLRLATLLLVPLLPMARCGDGQPTDMGVVRQGGIEATIVDRGRMIRVTNRRREPVGLFLVGEEVAGVIEWTPCADRERCEALSSGASKEVARSQVAGWDDDEGPILVYWWPMAPPGRMDPDSLGVLEVSIP